MTPAWNQKNRPILIVAAGNRQQRIAAQLSISSQPVISYDNVFQAIAGIAENQKKNVESIVLILVDSLAKQEMDVFQTLDQLSQVNTWALSGLNQPGQKKFKQALADGADGCAVLNNACPELARLTETLRQQPKRDQISTPEPSEIIEQTKPVPVLNNQQAVQKRQPPPPAKAKEPLDEDESMERLSDEELEALLGPSQPDSL